MQVLSRSILAGAFAFFVSLFLLASMLHSPMHPQELSFLMIEALFHLLIKIERDQKPVALMVVGAIVGGLLLTKVNLGIFVALPLIQAFFEVVPIILHCARHMCLYCVLLLRCQLCS